MLTQKIESLDDRLVFDFLDSINSFAVNFPINLNVVMARGASQPDSASTETKRIQLLEGPVRDQELGSRGDNELDWLGVLLIQFDAYELTRDCLKSLLETSMQNKKIFLLENYSSDYSSLRLFLEFPQLRVINPLTRVSYTEAFNILADQAISAGAKWIFITNNDTKDFDANIFEVLISEYNAEVGMISPKIVDFTAENIHWRPRQKLGIQFDIATEAYLIESRVWLQIGGFDESLTMYFEDLEFLLAIRRIGLEGTLSPRVSMAHYGSAAVSKMLFIPTFFPLRNVIWILRRNSSERFPTGSWHYFSERAFRHLKIAQSDIKQFKFGLALRRIMYVALAFFAGYLSNPKERRTSRISDVLKRSTLPMKFRLK